MEKGRTCNWFHGPWWLIEPSICKHIWIIDKLNSQWTWHIRAYAHHRRHTFNVSLHPYITCTIFFIYRKFMVTYSLYRWSENANTVTTVAKLWIVTSRGKIFFILGLTLDTGIKYIETLWFFFGCFISYLRMHCSLHQISDSFRKSVS